jgi:hypothetical protein
MDDVVIIKTADNVHNGVNTPDVTEKLVPEPFALAGTFDKAGNIDKFNGCRLNFLRLNYRVQLIHAGVRNLDNTDVRLNCAKRIICRLGACRGKRIKYG